MLLIQITKRTDGSGVLRCVRADGSVTWQKQEAPRAAFFVLHDLTHFAVESALSSRRGFFGLIAEGWDVADTTGKGARGPLPDEAAEVEYIVGSLGVERAGGTLWTEEAFNKHAALYAASAGRPVPRRLTAEELALIRSRCRELFAQWSVLPAGGTMELRFEH